MKKRTPNDPSSVSMTPSRQTLRSRLARLLGNSQARKLNARSLRLESLEHRQLLAGDVDLFATSIDASSSYQSNSGYSAAPLSVSTQVVPEGEAAPDLVGFAKALADAGVLFFGAAWCPHCTEQKQLFEDGANYLPFVEVTNPDHTANNTGISEGITSYPTWRFQDGTEVARLMTLAEISTASGIAIPQSETPSFVPVGDQTVGIGSPLHIPIDAYDPNGQPLTVTVTSSNPSLLQASVIQGNRSWRLKVAGYGDMVFELYEQRAPLPTSRIIELTQDDFYDGIYFHRILDNFVLQAGDPTGTGAGGSSLGDFDDQFNVDLQHNRGGVLSYAKSSDDTNDSQFFITEGPTRHLDFNHSIFGQLVEGEAVREAISSVPTDSSGRLLTNFANQFGQITISQAEVFNDTENSVVMLKPVGNATGTATVTITVTDSDGNQVSEVISVNVTADNQINSNGNPFLGPVSNATTSEGIPATIQLTSTDVEGDAVTYAAFKVGSVGYTTSVDQATGVVTVTPPTGYAGTFDVLVGVKPASVSATTADSSVFDLQRVSVTVQAGELGSISLNSASDSGRSNSDRITSSTSLTFTVTDTIPGATVELLSEGAVIASVVASGTTTQINTNALATNGNGTYTISARQVSAGVTSPPTNPITVVYDSAAPVEVDLPIPAQATVGKSYTADLKHVEEGNGLLYDLASAPTGMAIDPTTGVISWTPTASQVGAQTFKVTLTDVAGNVREQTFNVEVGSSPTVSLQLTISDLNGNSITQLKPGDEFLLNLTATDLRTFGSSPIFGVAAAFLDIIYDASLAETVGSNKTVQPNSTADQFANSPFRFASQFSNLRQGSAATPGLINELGAFAPSAPERQAAVVSIHMRALQAGTLLFSSDPADGDGTAVLVYGQNTELPAASVEYRSAAIPIVASFTAVDDVFNFDEDSTANTMNVLTNDTLLIAGTTLKVISTSAPVNGGVVTISSDGKSLSYSPAPNFNGADEFTYTVEDQTGTRQTATVSVGIQPVNDAPTAVADVVADIQRGSSNNVLDVLANDLIAPDENETLRIVSVGTTSQGGTVTIGSSGNHLLYTPAANFTGTDTFTYTISDRTTGGLTSTATVTVNVSQLATGTHVFTVTEDADAASFDVLGGANGDIAANPDSTTITVASIDSVSHGATVEITSTGAIRYRPAADFFGTETVTYTIRNAEGDSGKGTITFNVTGTNDPPIATNDSYSIAKTSGSNELELLNNDSIGVDRNETLRISAVDTSTITGTVTISSDEQSVIYTPNGTFTGTETFTYTLTDSNGGTDTGTVTIEVLDYVPRSVNFSFELGSVSGLNLMVTLSGTDDFGNSVQREVLVDSTGSYAFDDLAPGSYSMTVPEVPFLVGGEKAQTFPIESQTDDGDFELPAVTIGSLQAKYIVLRDWFGSTQTQSVMLAAAKPGDSAVYNLSLTNDLADITDPQVALSADSNQLTITAKKGTQTVSTSLATTSNQNVDIRGQQGDFQLMRIIVPDSANFTAASAVSSSSSAASSASSNASTASNNASTTAPEGEYSPAALGASSAMILPLGSGDVWQDLSSSQADASIQETAEANDQILTGDGTNYRTDPFSSLAAETDKDDDNEQDEIDDDAARALASDSVFAQLNTDATAVTRLQSP